MFWRGLGCGVGSRDAVISTAGADLGVRSVGRGELSGRICFKVSRLCSSMNSP